MAEETLINGEVESAFEGFVASHQNQLVSSGVPDRLWKTLHHKLRDGIFDAGKVFLLMRIEAEDDDEDEDDDEYHDDDGDYNKGGIKWKVVINLEAGISAQDPDQIYLVDHAWTFQPGSARDQLHLHPGLVERMADIFDLKRSGLDRESLVERVMQAKWKFAQTYSFGNADLPVEQRLPIWYIMDEFGSRIQHSDQPTCRLVPFFNLQDGCAYSILFPIRDCSHEEEITRNFLEGPDCTDPLARLAMMNIWDTVDVTHVDWRQSEPDAHFFQDSRINESLPNPDAELVPLPQNRRIKVFSTYEIIRPNLHHERFEMVDNEDEADILWLNSHFKNYRELSENYPWKRVNQFPHESVITVKDLLAVICRRSAAEQDEEVISEAKPLDTLPKWLPTTYNLKTELPKFVSYFQQRQASGLDNHWIVKPWNLARSLDTHICNDLSHLLKLQFSGPKIAQKYIENPVLFHREGLGQVKFDIRYIILLHSVRPLKLFAYDRFWLRFANEPFSLDNFDVYEKHFTVMNYTDAPLQKVLCHDFIQEFEAQNPELNWRSIEHSIFQMLRSVFEGACKLPPPCGIAKSPQSRAMFAVDLMLSWESSGSKRVEPKILEMNWGPDCARACDYYPEFFNNVFSVLFLDEFAGQNVTELE